MEGEGWEMAHSPRAVAQSLSCPAVPVSSPPPWGPGLQMSAYLGSSLTAQPRGSCRCGRLAYKHAGAFSSQGLEVALVPRTPCSIPLPSAAKVAQRVICAERVSVVCV